MPIGLLVIVQHRVLLYVKLLRIFYYMWTVANWAVATLQVIVTNLLLVKFLRLSIDISVAFNWLRSIIRSMSLFSFIVIYQGSCLSHSVHPLQKHKIV